MLTAPLTVVLLNHSRPEYVEQLVPHYLAMPNVQLSLVNCRTDTRVAADRSEGNLRVQTWDQDPGLAVRFDAGAAARTQSVLFVDDDLLLPLGTLQTLAGLPEALDGQLVGLFGRRLVGGKYVGRDAYRDVDILLTRAVLCPRFLCEPAAARVRRMVAELPAHEPRGNGEDIILSYTARDRGLRCIARRLPWQRMGPPDSRAISARYKQHKEHRQRVVDWCACPKLTDQADQG